MLVDRPLIAGRPERSHPTRQRLPGFEGISARTPFEQRSIREVGDFILNPSDVPHQPVNLSDTDQVIAVAARNDPNEQESIIPHHPQQPDSWAA